LLASRKHACRPAFPVSSEYRYYIGSPNDGARNFAVLHRIALSRQQNANSVNLGTEAKRLQAGSDESNLEQ